MEITAKHDEGILHICVDDEIADIEEGVFSIVTTDDFVNGVAKLFQKLIDKRNGVTSPIEASDKAHSYAGRIAREFTKRISQIYEEAVIEMVIEEELRELVDEEFPEK
jgi:hypothetical protein